MKQLHDKLVADLTRRRVLTDHVVRALMDRCELQSNEIKGFLSSRASQLEEALIDTIFSPMYTPTFEDRARYVGERERLVITPNILSEIIRELAREGLYATYLFEDEEVRMPLPEVIIDRWIQRLHLDQPIPQRIQQAIEATIPKDAQTEVKALSGHPAWRQPGREEILIAFLTAYARTGRFHISKFEYLTGLMHTYRPRDLAHFAHQVEVLVLSYQRESDEHFFDAHLKEAYQASGGTRPVQSHMAQFRQDQLKLATQLQEDLAEIAELSPR